jgi:hypothetical protein
MKSAQDLRKRIDSIQLTSTSWLLSHKFLKSMFLMDLSSHHYTLCARSPCLCLRARPLWRCFSRSLPVVVNPGVHTRSRRADSAIHARGRLRRPLPLMLNPAMATSDPVVAAANPSLKTANVMVPTKIMDLTRLEGKLGGEGASPPPSLSPHGFPASAVAAARCGEEGEVAAARG